MDVYEIINPSDTYTLKAASDEVATLAILLLGNGNYGGHKRGDDAFSVPMTLFSRNPQAEVDAAFAKYGGFIAAIKAMNQDVAEALESVLIGSFSDRDIAESALLQMPEVEQRVKWLRDRHNTMRSSMNDIGKTALNMAEKLRALRPSGA